MAGRKKSASRMADLCRDGRKDGSVIKEICRTGINNLYPLIMGTYIEGVTDLDRLFSPVIVRIVRRKMQEYVKQYRYPKLTGGQKRAIREYYRDYASPDTIYHRVYQGRTGEFHPDYIPDSLYFGKIEPYYTDRLCSRYLDNKCFYYHFFSNIRQPGPVVMRIGDFWLDQDFRLISPDQAKELVAGQECCVMKRATGSEGGSGIVFLDRNADKRTEFQVFAEKIKTDIVVQEAIRQHPAYAALNESSVNTIRLMTILDETGVWVFSGSVRMGKSGQKVDNVAKGGIICGVCPDGRLTRRGVTDDGSVLEVHPDKGFCFEDVVLPYYEKAVELAKKAHGIMAHCRLAAWDIAIDDAGEAVLVETNLSLGVIHTLQVISGPLFGDKTRRVLDEVYYDKSGRRRKAPYFGLNPRDYYCLRDNLPGALFGYYRSGYTHIYLLGNAALRHIDRKAVAEIAGLYPGLTRRQKAAIREYYRPYVKHFSTESHRVYTGKSHRFLPGYIPEDIYLCDIDRYLNDRELAYYLDNKCYYYRLFPYARQPEAVVMRINGIWLDADYQVLSKKQAARRIVAEDSVVVKTAVNSEGGEGVRFLDLHRACDRRERLSMFAEAIRGNRKDLVVQKVVRQHPDYAAFHPQSLNTLRIVSLLVDNKVEILTRSFKIGTGTSRLDNGCAGGIYCGVRPDGILGRIGALDDGRVVTEHPDLGYRIGGKKLPCLKQCDELVRASHPILGHHRLVSWDVAVDEEGAAVLIEANLALGGSDDVQVVNGTFFGSYTKRILEEVYGTANDFS